MRIGNQQYNNSMTEYNKNNRKTLAICTIILLVLIVIIAINNIKIIELYIPYSLIEQEENNDASELKHIIDSNNNAADSNNKDINVQFTLIEYMKYKNNVRKAIDDSIEEINKDADLKAFVKCVSITDNYTKANIYLNDKQSVISEFGYSIIAIELSYELQIYDIIRMQDNSIEVCLYDSDNRLLTAINEADINNIIKENTNSDDSIDTKEIIKESKKHVIKKGKTLKLATVKMKVSNVEYKNKLTSSFLDDTVAEDETKYLIITLNVENITREPLIDESFDSVLIDKKDREFTIDTDATISYTESSLYVTLQPNVPQKISLIYKIPKGSTGKYLLETHADTDITYALSLQ